MFYIQNGHLKWFFLHMIDLYFPEEKKNVGKMIFQVAMSYIYWLCPHDSIHSPKFYELIEISWTIKQNVGNSMKSKQEKSQKVRWTAIISYTISKLLRIQLIYLHLNIHVWNLFPFSQYPPSLDVISIFFIWNSVK